MASKLDQGIAAGKPYCRSVHARLSEDTYRMLQEVVKELQRRNGDDQEIGVSIAVRIGIRMAHDLYCVVERRIGER